MSLATLISLFTLACVQSFEITSVPRRVTTRGAGTLSLPCVVEGTDFSPFQNTLEWRKIQKEGDIEVGVQISVAASKKNAFASDPRFAVEAIQETGILSLPLNISDLQSVDSGHYVCKVETNDVLVTSVEHEINVYDPLSNLVMLGHKDSADRPDMSEMNGTMPVIEFSEGTPGFLQCTAYGGNPKPELRLFIGDRQITDQLTVVIEDVDTLLVGDTPGLQKIFRVQRIVDSDLDLSSSDSGKILKCEAKMTINEADTVTIRTSSMLVITGPPLYSDNCPDQTVATEEANMTIVCHFITPVTFTGVLWEGLESEEVINGALPSPNVVQHSSYMASVKVIDGMQYATLTILNVQSIHYQGYRLTITNQAGQRSKVIKLLRSTAGRATSDGSTVSRAWPLTSHLLLTCLFSCHLVH